MGRSKGTGLLAGLLLLPLPALAHQGHGHWVQEASTRAWTYSCHDCPDNLKGQTWTQDAWFLEMGRVVANQPAVTLSAASVVAGGPVTVTVAHGPGNPTDWIGLATASNPEVVWAYLNGTHEPPAAGLKAATVTLVAPAAGTYQVRLYPRNAYTPVLAEAPLVVTAVPTIPRVSWANGVLSWDYPEGAVGIVDFQVFCGEAGSLPLLTVRDPAQRAVRLNAVLPATTGLQTCWMTARTVSEASAPSPSVTFTLTP
jgi:hypothetical protein